MNVRHLELFFHVVKNRGISRAIGRMPFGIQQPALSEQIALLEDHLGGKLFDRRPFRLTPEGEQLYVSIRDFFENLDNVGEAVRVQRDPLFRIAADSALIDHYAQPVLVRFRKSCPEARLTLIAGKGEDAVRDLHSGDVDLSISTIEGKSTRGLVRQRLAARRLVLMVRKKSRVHSAAQFWHGGKMTEPLIAPTWSDGISQTFQQGLKRGHVSWPPRIVSSSIGTVAPCVAGGAGVGLAVQASYLTRHASVRVLPLAGFNPVYFCAYWKPENTTKLKPLITAIQDCVEE